MRKVIIIGNTTYCIYALIYNTTTVLYVSIIIILIIFSIKMHDEWEYLIIYDGLSDTRK